MKKYLLGSLLSLLVPGFVKAGGDGGGGGGGDTFTPGTGGYISSPGLSGSVSPGASGNYSDYNATTGTYTDYSYNTDANGVTVSANPSTPFLLIEKDGQFVHENDFLFGKPNTAFANYKLGLKAYQHGIGGDTYLLSPEVKANKDGRLNLQIRELEPEESYIDKFELNSIDLAKDEHFIADGNLEAAYVFNTNEASVVSGKTYKYQAKENSFKEVEVAYTSLVPQKGESLVMHTDDELLIRLKKSRLDLSRDTFVLVDSHYRDWTLGSQVPFSFMERFTIGSLSLGKSTVTTLAGVTVLAATLVAGAGQSDNQFLKRIVTLPYTYADVQEPCAQECNNIFNQNDANTCQICKNNNYNYYYGNNGGRSLVVSIGDSAKQTYLQTLFPRYVKATQEVVKIPKELIDSIKEEIVTLRIKATKKHKVLTAFVFQAKAKVPRLTPLKLLAATKSDDNKDFTTTLSKKDGNFLHTIPGDVINLSYEVSNTVDTNRRYVLKANGFYTKLSPSTYAKVGKNWIDRLAVEDRNLLKQLRLA